MSDELLVNTLIIMARIESKQPGAMPFEDNPLYVASERIKQLNAERDAALSQVERLLNPAKEAAEALGFASHHLRGRASVNMLMDMAGKADALIRAIGSTPAQSLAYRDAEIKAQAVEPIFNNLKAAHGESTHPRAKVYLCEEAFELAAKVMQLRQQVKGE